MSRKNFVRSLAFGAVAALASVPWLLMARSFVGSQDALRIFLVMLVPIYLVTLAATWSRGIRFGALAGVLGVVVLALAPDPFSAAVGAAVLLGVMRSGFMYRSRPGRALLMEMFLLGGGLFLAQTLGGANSLSMIFAVWGFFLVQSVYFLIGGIGERADEPKTVDPFERACRGVTQILEERSA